MHGDAKIDMREEWLNTRLLFEIAESDAHTTITLTHYGLSPDLNCYEICQAGWDHCFLGSLKNHRNNAAGEPNSY